VEDLTAPLAPVIEDLTAPLAPVVEDLTAPLAPIAEDLTAPLAPIVEDLSAPLAPALDDVTSPLAPLAGDLTTPFGPAVQDPTSAPIAPGSSPVAGMPVASAPSTPISVLPPLTAPHSAGPVSHGGPAASHQSLPIFDVPLSPGFGPTLLAAPGHAGLDAGFGPDTAAGGSSGPLPLPGTSGSSAAAGGFGGAAGGTLFALLLSLAAFGLRHSTRLRLSSFAFRPQAFVAVIERPG
jgi:hypothetical protein